jgi:plasmanylethanolamine desaturase
MAEYSSRFRLVEISAIVLFSALFAALAVRGHATPFPISAAFVATVLFSGALVADFVSGLVHWSADTWGDQTWPIVGPTLIRSFREHHVDEKAITRHDFVETNGATALVALPVMLAVFFLMPRDGSTWTPLEYQGTMFWLSLSFFVFMTNQIHKWAHLDQPPLVARTLQRMKVILPVAHHHVHHTGQYTAHYCITTGWLNPILDRVGFFRASEKLIQAVSPLRPREDDLKWIASASQPME